MIFNCLDMVELDYKYQKKLLVAFEKKLNQLSNNDNTRLIAQKVDGRIRYYLYWRENGAEKRKYLSKSNTKLIEDLQLKFFLEKEIAAIRNNIFELQSLLLNYKSIDPTTILDNAPVAYNSAKFALNTSLISIRTNSWKKEMQQIKDCFPLYKPEQLKHTAIDGTKTRSKSETIIYNLLIAKGIPFIYELPLKLGDSLLLPDFILNDNKNNRTVIIEHMGLMTFSGYNTDQMEKTKTYVENNWVPNVNLLLTFEDGNGNIDVQSINKAIDCILS